MASEPELRQLRAFVAVAEELHFTRAAERLNMAQQALSAQIRNLEARLGVELFVRSTRKVELTDAGRTLLDHAVSLLAAVSRACEEVAQVGAGEIGQISISYAPTARRDILPRLLGEFHQRYPRIEVHTCEVFMGSEVVSKAIVDVAITRAAPRPDSDLAAAPVCESLLGIVLGAGHPLARRESVRGEDLAGQTLQISARRLSPEFYDLIVGLLNRRGFAGPVHEYENLGPNFILDDESACEAISSCRSFGVGFENQYNYLPPQLVWRPLEPSLRVPLNMCWQQGARPAVANFVSVALEVARGAGWLPVPPREVQSVA